jgi:hypothetical protein
VATTYRTRLQILRNVSVDPVTGCWNWQRRCMPREGYGIVTSSGRRRSAHRVSYEVFIGPIPDGLWIDHLCRNRRCVNPHHLEPVTPQENILRSPIAQAALNAAKTHCPQGHEYTPANTYLYGPHRRWRICRSCTSGRSRKKASS